MIDRIVSTLAALAAIAMVLLIAHLIALYLLDVLQWIIP